MENENINLGDTYEIVRQIGSGGGGTVYLAYHNRLQKNVVIKKMRDGVKLDYRRYSTSYRTKPAYIPLWISSPANRWEI